MKKVLGAIAGVAALGLFTAANAAVSVTGGDLTDSSPTGVQLDPDAPGPVDPTSPSIDVSTTELTKVEVDFTRSDGTMPRVLDLTFSIIDQDNNVLLSETLTDAGGVGTSPTEFVVDLTGATSFTVAFSGTAEFGTGQPSPDVNIFLSQVPVPAALPLLLSGIGGLAFASRRRKKA